MTEIWNLNKKITTPNLARQKNLVCNHNARFF